MARVLLYTLACNGKQGIEQRGERTDYYAGAVACVKSENQQYAGKRYHAQHYLPHRHTSMARKRFYYSCEESVQGYAYHGNAHVGGFYTCIKQHPVYSQQHAASCYSYHMRSARHTDLMAHTKHHCKHQSGNNHSIPYQRQFRQ